MEEEEWTQIIHNDCGLPVEFCVCPNTGVIYNSEDDTFTILDKESI